MFVFLCNGFLTYAGSVIRLSLNSPLGYVARHLNSGPHYKNLGLLLDMACGDVGQA